MLRWCQTTVRELDGLRTSITGSPLVTSSGRVIRRPLKGSATVNYASSKLVVLRTINIGRIPSVVNTSRQRQAPPLQTALSTHVESRLGSCIPVTTDSPTTASSIANINTHTEALPHDPFTVLTLFLSQTNSPASHSPKFTAHSLICLYQSLKTRHQLDRLSSKQFTELLCLLGTLSLPSPRNPCIYFSKLLPHAEETAFETYWPTVLDISRQKERSMKTLNGTDRYWIMRAQLAKMVPATQEPLEPNDPRLRAFSQAKMQYLRIWRHSPDPEIHVPYFDGLLHLTFVSELVLRICKILELYPNLHFRITDIFWRVLLKHSQDLTPEHKERILSMVVTRVSMNVGAPSASKVFDANSKRPKLVALKISDLSSSLDNVVFPSHSPPGTFPRDVRQWASAQALSTFVSAVSPDARWWSFLLLVIRKSPETPAGSVATVSQMDAESVDWRTVFLLAVVDQTLAGVDVISAPESRKEMQDFIRPIWLSWKEAEALHKERPINVTRGITAAFFRIGAKILDEPLVQGCFRFCVANSLFKIGSADGGVERIQANDLRLAYVFASVTCGKNSLQVALSSLELQGARCRKEVLEGLMWHYLSYDVSAAHGVYLLGKKHDVEFSSAIIHRMSLGFATSSAWRLALPFLYYSGFSRAQLEGLVGAILRIFRDERRENIGPTHAQSLGDAMWSLYAHHAPSKQLKYPIRFCFQIMIASGRPSRAVSLVEAIHTRVPNFFTTRLFLRLARALVRYRHIHLIPRILQLLPKSSTRASDDFRRKITLLLARADAHAQAKMVYRMGIRREGRRTGRESMARAVGFHVKKPSTFHSLKIVPILARSPTDGPSVKYAVNILVRANRSYAARKVLGRFYHHLDKETRTSIGNTILHGDLKQHILRNGRLVRHILRTKELLEESYGFVPDRVTTNIVIKAILRWREAITVQKVRALFDHMVRCGYPASSHWCRENGVPFGTSSSSSTFEVPKLPSGISFERHVRPMYKMFVKALYAREDVRGAKTVVGILKEEEGAAMRRREERNRARKEGLVRKWKRESTGSGGQKDTGEK